MLTTVDANPVGQARFARFSDEMAKLGWIEGRNLRSDVRFGGGDADRLRAYAVELVNLNPDVIVAFSVPATLTLEEKTQTIPIVMIGGGDVFATGVVKNIAHPEATLPESPI